MAVNDLQMLNERLYGTLEVPAEDRTTSSVTVAMLPGEPVKRSSSNNVIPITNGGPTQGTDIWVGVVKEESTETSSVDGTVVVYLVGPGSRLRGKATTVSNMNTVALLDAILLNYVNFDLTGAGTNGPTGVFTIDENESDTAATLSLCIFTGDTAAGTLEVGCVNSSLWTGTM